MHFQPLVYQALDNEKGPGLMTSQLRAFSEKKREVRK